jgi:hypothetical protein
MSLILITTISSEFMLYASAVAITQFVWFIILLVRPEIEFEERMQGMASESAIETINSQSSKPTRHQI